MTHEERALRDRHIRTAFQIYQSRRKNRYRIIKEISSKGAFSAVYEVCDPSGNEIILKAIDTELVDVSLDGRGVKKYATTEIELMKKCKDCPYVMDLLDSEDIVLNPEIDHHVFLLFMPRLQCATDYFKKNGYDLHSILSMTKDVCKALVFCHRIQILHRDIKPDNIFYSQRLGHFVLSDFGVSRMLFPDDLSVTVVGTRQYLAPEIYNCKDLNGRMNADIYSLGMCVLTLNAEMTKGMSKTREPLDNLNVRLRAAILKAIESDPAVRYQTAMEFYHAIEKFEPVEKPSESQCVRRCLAAFKKNDFRTAEKAAVEGYREGHPIPTCLYAYVLASQGKTDEALKVLEPLKAAGNPKAVGLYGIIGRMSALKEHLFAKDMEMVELIRQSAEKGFAPAQYYIGRWMIDGESGFQVDVRSGVRYIFKSGLQGFLPAMDYFRKTLKRKPDLFDSVDSIENIFDIELRDYSKEQMPFEMIQAICGAK